ncbi:Imm42 family immunity protein [Pseudomonas sp. RW3S2]|uniref:Imm42 family immunity protein n=1 Tax=Pseudomonas sp. RW3S2 TaxID=485884 RepID=UPI00164435CF|nr:hypothetical protein [Pseudomonas sp. RW3S2]
MTYYNAGKKELFSVCCSTCAPNFKSGWMAVNLSLDNHLIGANEEITQIDTFLNMISVKFDNYDLDYADSLKNLDKSAVLSQIEQGYEHSQNWIDSSKIGALFLSLNLTPCLDGDVVILLMLETTDRVIWKAHDDDVVQEIFLPPGYVKNTLNDVINFFSPPKNHD